MNVTLAINLAATLGMGVAVWLAGADYRYGAFYALVLTYVSGLLTAVASQYQITAVRESVPSTGSNQVKGKPK